MLLAILALGLVIPGRSVAQQPRAALSGLWRLNPEKSQEMGESRSGNGQGYEGQRGMPPLEAGRTRGVPSGGRPEPAPDPTVLLGFLRPVLQVLIRQTDSTIAVSDASGQLATYPTNGRKIREPQLIGEDAEITAKWKDGSLSIERKLPSLGTVKETYWRDSATGELVLLVKVSGSRLPRGIEMRRVYEPVSEGK
jgi:hypothetical protein